MTTVFMQWLETRPKDNDRGIRLLTLGRHEIMLDHIVKRFVQLGLCVLQCPENAIELRVPDA